MGLESMTKNTLIDTLAGKLLGFETSVDGQKVSVFKGIPYALPPIGQRRWMPPETMPRWKGVRCAYAFGPASMQPTEEESSFYYNPTPLMSEDCLYLNIWSPGGREEFSTEMKPVMVWVHGGALVNGRGSQPLYDGARLAAKGVVVVTINYRLDVFGYLSHSELNEESPVKASGNYGTLDQIMALRWLQENISNFGGDLGNITVFGESAGGLSVSHLMASPLAKGLFQKAIVESGYLLPNLSMGETRYGRAAAIETGRQLQEAAGVTSLKELRELPATSILAAARTIEFFPETVTDNYVFQEDVEDAFKTGRYNKVPLLLGFNSGEAGGFATLGVVPEVPQDSESYRYEVVRRYGELADEYLELYPAANPEKSVYDAARDALYGWATLKMAELSVVHNQATFMYFFDYVSKEAKKRGLGAFHASELPFVFNNVCDNTKYSENWPDWPTESVVGSLADLISDCWISFAESGHPTVGNERDWPAFDLQTKAYVRLNGDGMSVETDLISKAYQFHEKVIERRKREGTVSWDIMNIGLFAPPQIE